MSEHYVGLVLARTLLGWTQSELARRANTRVSNISDLESGNNGNPSWSLVLAVVGALQKGGLVGLRPEMVFPAAEAQKSA